MTPKHWLSDAPGTCDLCHEPITYSFTDGKTARGPWAIMCPSCHFMHGLGHGTGRGQEYTHQPDNSWLKTKG